jgi:hypothetical protein
MSMVRQSHSIPGAMSYHTAEACLLDHDGIMPRPLTRTGRCYSAPLLPRQWGLRPFVTGVVGLV